MLHTELWCRAPNELRSHDSRLGAHADGTKSVNGLPPGSAQGFLRQMTRRWYIAKFDCYFLQAGCLRRKRSAPNRKLYLSWSIHVQKKCNKRALHPTVNTDCCVSIRRAVQSM